MAIFLEILAEYGIVSAMLATFLIVIFLLLKTKVVDETFVPYIFGQDRKTKKPLYTHSFFSNIEFKINIDLPVETFSEHPIRNIMYQDMMVILFSCYLKHMSGFVKFFNPRWEVEDWRLEINRVHYNAIEEFESECAKSGVPEIAIKIFMIWYNTYLNRIYQYINHVAKMPDLTPEGKTRVFLLVLELILATVTADAQRQSILNGELSGMEYNGLTL